MNRNSINLTKKVWQDPYYFIAFGFGSGLLPTAPGTWGTLAAIPIYLLIAGSSWVVYLAVTVFLFGAGVFICEKVSNAIGIHDFSGIVIDEIVGYLITMFLAPITIYWMVFGFLLFRLFDVWKPQPIQYIDNYVKGGLGIMLDDIGAAIPAWLILQLAIWITYRGAI